MVFVVQVADTNSQVVARLRGTYVTRVRAGECVGQYKHVFTDNADKTQLLDEDWARLIAHTFAWERVAVHKSACLVAENDITWVPSYSDVDRIDDVVVFNGKDALRCYILTPQAARRLLMIARPFPCERTSTQHLRACFRRLKVKYVAVGVEISSYYFWMLMKKKLRVIQSSSA
jgi:hypothetical protein